MADLDALRARGIPARALVDAVGVAINGTKTIAELSQRGMRPICQVDATGTHTSTSATQAALRSRGIPTFCELTELGVDPVSGLTIAQLSTRGVRGMCPVTALGIAQTGTATIDQLRARGIQYFCPVDEGGTATTLGGGLAYIDVFAGQSNAQTNFTTLAGKPAYIVADAAVEIWNYDTSAFVQYSCGVNSLQPTTQVDSGGGVAGNWGAEAEFSYRMRLLFPTRPVFIVKYAIGSTRLAADTGNDWNPSSSASEYFGRVEAAITAAKAALVLRGYTPIVRTIHWMQGEADAGNATYDAAYPTNLPALVTAMRSRWGDANTFIVIGRILPSWATNPNVRPTQVTVGNASALNEWLNADRFAVTSAHYNDAGASQFGKDSYYAFAVGQTEKAVNGTFDTVFAPWTGQKRDSGTGIFSADNSILSISSGALLITHSAGITVGSAIQAISGLTIGATYKVLGNVTRTDNPARVAVTSDAQGLGTDFGASGTSFYNSGSIASPAAVDGSFVPTQTTVYISLQNFSLGTTGVVGFDNISIIGP
jgi:hypothetical protein